MQHFQLEVHGELWKWLSLGNMSDESGEFQVLPRIKNVLLLDNMQSSIIYTKDWEIVYFGHHKTPLSTQVPNISRCSNVHLITTPMSP